MKTPERDEILDFIRNSLVGDERIHRKLLKKILALGVNPLA
jgi:hypothetical protein